ncbi:MAG: SPOR domain-containing protein [Pseudomonadota bacterium]
MSRYGHDPIDFGSLDEEYRGYDERSDDASRGPLILALAAGVLIVFAAVVWNTYRQGVRGDSGPLPVIAAEDTDFKRRPDVAGGMEVPNQDRHIYDAFESDGSAQDADVVQANVPDDRLSGGADIERDAVPDIELNGRIDAGALPEPRRLAAIDEPVVSANNSVNELGMAPSTEPTLPVPDPDPVYTPAFGFSSGGAYLVQIAALRDEAGAMRAWNDVVAAHPAIFEGAAQSIQRADLGARGVFYRLRAGRFADRSGAAEFCAALKDVGRDCIVVR